MVRRFAFTSVIVAVIAISGQGAAAQEQKMKQPERIAAAELKKKLDGGEKFLLIDVREDWELKQDGAIPGAIHIPVAELDKRMKDIPKDVELVFY
jgi:hypothetical protein